MENGIDSANHDPHHGGVLTPGDASGGLSGSIPDSPGDDGMGPPDGLGGPAPKRRRVTRACDECRRKKIKCDGKQVYTSISICLGSVLTLLALYTLCCVLV